MNNLSKLFRQKIDTLPDVNSIDVDWLYFNACLIGRDYWSLDKDIQLSDFKKKVKKFYFEAQNHYCCYCSVEIDNNRRLYDLEHVIDQNGRSDLMFDLQNLASSCVQCNLAKTNKQVTKKATNPGDPLPIKSSQYLLVHPHLDEWNSHFSFDKYDRIIPLEKSKKGNFTFELCKIHNRNIARLARYFRYPHRSYVEEILSDIYSPHNLKRAEQLKVLKKISDKLRSSDTRVVIEIIKNDLAIKNLLPPKYSTPSGQHWSGKGRRPRWVHDIIKTGETLELYANY